MRYRETDLTLKTGAIVVRFKGLFAKQYTIYKNFLKKLDKKVFGV